MVSTNYEIICLFNFNEAHFLPISQFPGPRQILTSFLSLSIRFFFLEFHINEITQGPVSSVCLPSLSIFLTFIHDVMYVSSWFHLFVNNVLLNEYITNYPLPCWWAFGLFLSFDYYK